MLRTSPCLKLATTRGGMRRMLKRLPPVDEYIRQAVKAGVYQSPDAPPVRRRYNNNRRGTSIQDYPIEYQILQLHPPIPDLPKIPAKELRRMKRQEGATGSAVQQQERLIQAYLQRQEQQQQKQGDDESAAARSSSVDDYYQELLGIAAPAVSSSMGQKSALLNKAYAFTLKQAELMRQDNALSTEESVKLVEDILAKQDEQERATSRQTTMQIKEWRVKNPTSNEKETTNNDVSKRNATPPIDDDLSTLPSILTNKPRTIQAMTLWSRRLQAVHYREWTIGATVALDHWIARSILDFSEEAWQDLLEGNDATGNKARARDVLMTRQALFPETIVTNEQVQPPVHDDDERDETTKTDTTEDKTIDELLASLGDFGDDDKGKDSHKFTWVEEDEHASQEGLDAKIEELVNQLQEWRAKNMETPYNEWSSETKRQFEDWIQDYVSTLTTDSSEKVDLVATRKALLASPPVRREDSNAFWEQVVDETEAEILLQDMLEQRAKGNVDTTSTEAARIFWDLSYEQQLEKLVNLGTLRPILDEYTTEATRNHFLELHADKLLEGTVMEHLVEDKDGPISSDDLGQWAKQEFGVTKDQRFSIERLPFGQDEFGTTRAQRARELYKAWNTHKAGRARYEENLFQQGKLGLQYEKAADEKKKLQ